MYKIHENRNKLNQIVNYDYEIVIPKKKKLIGTLSREDVEQMASLYCRNGHNMTMRQVAKYYPQFTFDQFKSVLRAFQIYKDKIPLAKHQIEEFSITEAAYEVLTQKELQIEKKAEAIERRAMDSKIRKLTLDNFRLKKQLDEQEKLLFGIEYDKIDLIPIHKQTESSKATLVIYLSDLHIGAEVSKDSIYENTYNLDVVKARLHKILETVNHFLSSIDDIIVFNLGDMIDGLNHSTTRPEHTHFLPQNMTNKEMLRNYVSVMDWFINRLAVLKPVMFYSVCESNHGGDPEYAATLALNAILTYKGVKSFIADTPIAHTKLHDTTIIYFHGKDNFNQNKPFPLTLNDNAENLLNEYIIRNGLQGKILVVKGDQHRSAMTTGKLFEYKSVGSLFGSSAWIMANFGKSDWSVDFSLFYKTGERVDGRITE